MRIREVVHRVIDSPITQVGRWKNDASPDLPLIDVSQAAPTYPPARELRNHIAAQAQSPATATYTDQQGVPELRVALARALTADYDAPVAVEHMAVTAGCNQAFCLAMMALTEPGDEVLLPLPSYFNHDMWLRSQDVEPVYLEPGPDMLPDPQGAAASITDRTRAIVLVTPNNPTGAVYPPALIESFFELARERGLVLVIDETYREFREHSEPPHTLFARPDWSETLIHLYSFSKAYCMAGYRIGCMATNPALLRETLKIADCVALCPSHIGQLAATFCLEHLDDWKREYRRTVRDRVAYAARRLREANTGFDVVSSGGYFVYLRHPFTDRSSVEVGRKLAEDHGILCLAGSMFGPGQDRYLRLAFANVDLPAIDELVARLRRVR
ncbi:MAG: aminotransferase [Acidobacteriota bacterium]|nr:aminotransferase [Acidobacteriota bacterium]MDE3265002.1 aminotransferase [Acidobacteriota bacterium]